MDGCYSLIPHSLVSFYYTKSNVHGISFTLENFDIDDREIEGSPQAGIRNFCFEFIGADLNILDFEDVEPALDLAFTLEDEKSSASSTLILENFLLGCGLK